MYCKGKAQLDAFLKNALNIYSDQLVYLGGEMGSDIRIRDGDMLYTTGKKRRRHGGDAARRGLRDRYDRKDGSEARTPEHYANPITLAKMSRVSPIFLRPYNLTDKTLYFRV